jgi:hypothetical protein
MPLPREPPTAKVMEVDGMAWRPYDNLMEGILDNTGPGKVRGRIRFYRDPRFGNPFTARLDLEGDFLEDVRGKVLELHNENPSDRGTGGKLSRVEDYMKNFSRLQKGKAGDITVGLPIGVLTPARIEEKIYLYRERLLARLPPLEDPDAEVRRYAENLRAREGRPEYAYTDYPYIEWYSEHNDRVVLELSREQVKVHASLKEAMA